ncbi:MAG TPA: cupin domain-containing protein [Gemmatimonadota bacterium]|nr:cupin domain-containing protein [Gemmatimonadota bacterium]
MSVGVVNLGDLEYEKRFEGGVRFATEWADISRRLGGRKLGVGHWIVPPGKVSVPNHAHLVNEEMVLVLGGEIRVRLNDRVHPLTAGDLVALPPGPDSVHQLLNYSDRPANLILASTMIPREVVDYPDSGKRGIAVAGLEGDTPMTRVMLKDGELLGPDPSTYFAGEPIDEPLGDPPDPPPERDPRIVTIEDVPWEPYEMGPFRAGRKRLSRAAGAHLLGYSLYRLDPGARTWPYHFQHVNEEFFFVRRGHGELRTPDGAWPLKPGDFVLCPPGPSGAHGIRGTGDIPLEVFALSTMEVPEISEYPDSGKVYVMAGAAPGGDPAARTLDMVFRRADAVDYLDGEG